MEQNKPNEKENQPYNSAEIEELWAYLGRLCARKEGIVVELRKNEVEMVRVARQLRELN